MLGVVAYIVLHLIVGFGYMLQESPNAVVNAYVEQAEWKQTVTALKASPPAYCDNPATDYNFSATWTYVNNACDYDLDLGDVLTKGENAVFVTTYFQDTPLDPAAAAAAGLPSAKESFFVPGVEAMRLSFDHTVTTSWGLTAVNPVLALRALGNSTTIAAFEGGRSVTIAVADLLGVAGASLDATNLDRAGGPLYRLSGMHVRVAMKYSNMDAAAPLDRAVKADAAVDYLRGVWTSVGPKIVHKADAAGKLHKFQRYHYALRVSFVTTGTLGTPDAFAALTNLAVALGMLGVAVTVVDALSEYLVDNFDDMKYDDRNDWMTLESLKAHAVESGILDEFAEEHGMRLLNDDVMRRIRARAAAKRTAKAEAEATKASLGVDGGGGAETETAAALQQPKQKDNVRIAPSPGVRVPVHDLPGADGGMVSAVDGDARDNNGSGSSNSWENAMARVLLMEQKAFLAQNPLGSRTGRNLPQLPDTAVHTAVHRMMADVEPSCRPR